MLVFFTFFQFYEVYGYLLTFIGCHIYNKSREFFWIVSANVGVKFLTFSFPALAFASIIIDLNLVIIFQYYLLRPYFFVTNLLWYAFGICFFISYSWSFHQTFLLFLLSLLSFVPKAYLAAWCMYVYTKLFSFWCCWCFNIY